LSKRLASLTAGYQLPVRRFSQSFEGMETAAMYRADFSLPFSGL